MASLIEIESMLAKHISVAGKGTHELLNKKWESFNPRLDTITSSVEGLCTRLSALEAGLINTTSEVDINTEGIKILSFEADVLTKQRLVDLENLVNSKDTELEQLHYKVNDQTDRKMQEALIISGIEGQDKTWEETRILLSQNNLTNRS